MKVLALDTALAACSAAVWVDGHVAAARWEARERGHAEAIMPMLEEVRSAAGLGYGDLDLIAVTVGPGTFTGLRIGLAAARGLGLAAACPVMGLTTLEAVAAGVDERLREGAPLAVVLDARRGELYGQGFDSALEPLGPPCVLRPEEALALLPGARGALVGTGAQAVAAALAGRAPEVRPADAPALPDARVIAGLAAAKARAGLSSAPPAPLYLRPPDARLPEGTARP